MKLCSFRRDWPLLLESKVVGHLHIQLSITRLVCNKPCSFRRDWLLQESHSQVAGHPNISVGPQTDILTCCPLFKYSVRRRSGGAGWRVLLKMSCVLAPATYAGLGRPFPRKPHPGSRRCAPTAAQHDGTLEERPPARCTAVWGSAPAAPVPRLGHEW